MPSVPARSMTIDHMGRLGTLYKRVPKTIPAFKTLSTLEWAAARRSSKSASVPKRQFPGQRDSRAAAQFHSGRRRRHRSYPDMSAGKLDNRGRGSRPRRLAPIAMIALKIQLKRKEPLVIFGQVRMGGEIHLPHSGDLSDFPIGQWSFAQLRFQPLRHRSRKHHCASPFAASRWSKAAAPRPVRSRKAFCCRGGRSVKAFAFAVATVSPCHNRDRFGKNSDGSGRGRPSGAHR